MARVGKQDPTFTNVRFAATLGDRAIETYHESGQTLVEWQAKQVKAIMAITPDGLWKYMKYGLSVSRRNGKGEILSAREMDGLMNGEKICHTAHRTTTSHDAFNRLYRLLQKSGYEEFSKKKKEMPEKSFYASKQYGLEHIEVVGGGVIDFRTRTNNGGLGEGFDLLVIDEAQEYTSKQESSLSYTVTASKNPQIIMVGTPPTAVSSGDVFPRLRGDIREGKAAEEVGWAEWSIEELTEDVSNVELWYEFNPSLGTILTERNIRAELSNSVVDFNIQRLGLWLAYDRKSAISAAEWDAMEVATVPEMSTYYIGVKYGKGPNVAASIAGKTPDGRIFVECLGCKPMRSGNGWILEFIRNPKVMDVIVDGASGQKILADDMQRFGYFQPKLPKVAEVVSANALWEQAITAQTICHKGQESLRTSVSNCEKRPIGSSGGFGYKSLSDLIDITIMDSAILAHYLASMSDDDYAQSVDY